jgi:hypothetical protein
MALALPGVTVVLALPTLERCPGVISEPLS